MSALRRCGIVVWLLVVPLTACTGDDPAAPRSTPGETTPRIASVAGLVGPDGTRVEVAVPSGPTGRAFDVTDLGADPGPGAGMMLPPSGRRWPWRRPGTRWSSPRASTT